MDFKVGQEVCYIERSCPEIGLIKDHIYTVLQVDSCNCGQCIYIGIDHKDPFTYCADCGQIINIDDRWFFSSQGFIPVVRIDILEAIPAHNN